MYQMELQSSSWLKNHAADRPSFEASVARGFSSHEYQVFAMQHGLLFLEQKNKPGSGASRDATGAVVAGAVLGGAVGAVIGGMLAGGFAGPTAKETGLEVYSDEELFALARSRKHSFVAEQDEIESVSIDAPGFFTSLFNSRVVGTITIRDSRLGKVTLNLRDQAALSVAVDAFPRRFADRVRVNVRWDEGKMRFVPAGR